MEKNSENNQRIPFNFSLRKEIENGDYAVVTRDGKSVKVKFEYDPFNPTSYLKVRVEKPYGFYYIFHTDGTAIAERESDNDLFLIKTAGELKPSSDSLTGEPDYLADAELNSLAYLETLGYTCIPPSETERHAPKFKHGLKRILNKGLPEERQYSDELIDIFGNDLMALAIDDLRDSGYVVAPSANIIEDETPFEKTLAELIDGSPYGEMNPIEYVKENSARILYEAMKELERVRERKSLVPDGPLTDSELVICEAISNVSRIPLDKVKKSPLVFDAIRNIEKTINAEMYKNLPRWHRMVNGAAGGGELKRFVIKRWNELSTSSAVGPGDTYLTMDELEKLPKDFIDN